MLNGYELYNISTGIFNSYNRGTARSFGTNHKKETIEKGMKFIPSRYQMFTKENYITLCLYLVFTKHPTSAMGLYSLLSEEEGDDYMKFKNNILYYKKNLNLDINYLKEVYGSGISKDDIVKEYLGKKINWYTFWFYIQKRGYTEEIMKSRVNRIVIKKIEFLLKYVTFSDQSLSKIDELLQESLEL